MQQPQTSRSTVIIHAPASKVWQTITEPTAIKAFMMGMEAISSWKEGDKLTWKGRHEDKPEDTARGKIITFKPPSTLAYTFYYPGYGYPDEPTYYNLVVYTLQPAGADTNLTIEQGDFSVFKEGEVFLGHTQKFWDAAVEKIKELVEHSDAV